MALGKLALYFLVISKLMQSNLTHDAGPAAEDIAMVYDSLVGHGFQDQHIKQALQVNSGLRFRKKAL